MSSESGGSARTSGRKRGKPGAAKGDAQETSAGGVVIRGEPGREQVVTIVPVRRAPGGARVLCLPKGHIDPGENALGAATREVREEAGVAAELLRDLGEVRYWYRRGGRTVSKSVVFFLFRYVSGETSDHDDEVEQARWIDLRAALTELSYEGERSMIARALALLDEGSAPETARKPGSPAAHGGSAAPPKRGNR
jgi:8-oxo-dGTP pyrophosphatase MutT (NUDIX family)